MLIAPLVAAIVVGTNELRWLEVCLRSLRASQYPNLRVIYVDNASSDGSLAFVRQAFPDVESLENVENLGFAGANNRGMRHAIHWGADYVFLVNPDTRTPVDLVGRLVAFLESFPVYGAVGPLQAVYSDLAQSEPSPNSWTLHALDNGERHVFHHWAPRLAGEAAPVERHAPEVLEHAYIQGAALALRVSALDAAGLFDPVYHTFYEDVDLCRRIRWAGYRVALIKSAWIEHAGGSEAIGGPTPYRCFYMTRNRFLYLFTDPGIPLGTVIILTLKWISDDLLVQLPSPFGLVSGVGQYIRIWGSLLSLVPHIFRTRRRNRLMSRGRSRVNIFGPYRDLY